MNRNFKRNKAFHEMYSAVNRYEPQLGVFDGVFKIKGEQ